MPPHSLILAIDLGTSAVKAGLFDATLRLHRASAAGYRVDRPRPGWVEVDPRRWWRAVRRSVGDLVHRGNARSVAAIAFSTLYPGVVLVDDRWRPLRPAILYCDTRGGAEGRAFERRIGRDRLVQRTGNAVHPGTPALSAIVWLGRYEPDILHRTRWLLQPNGYVAARLTGRATMDHNCASMTGLLDVRGAPAWWGDLAERTGLSAAALPPLVPSHQAVGELSAAGARALGLPAGIPVVLGAGDTACSALAGGLLDSGPMVVACGSSDTATMCLREPVFPPDLINVLHAVPGRRLCHATVTSAGLAVEWAVRTLFGGGASAFKRALRAAGKAPAGAGEVVFLPYLQGERTPVWSDTARGVFVGLSPGTDRGALMRAVLEGVAFALRHNVDCLEQIAKSGDHLPGPPPQGTWYLFRSKDPRRGVDLPAGKGTRYPSSRRANMLSPYLPVPRFPRTAVLVGGGARSPLLNQIRADVLNRPLVHRRLRGAEGSEPLAGAALLGAVGVGLVSSLAAGARLLRAHVRTTLFRPRVRPAMLYDRVFQVYRQLPPALADTFAALEPLQSR